MNPFKKRKPEKPRYLEDLMTQWLCVKTSCMCRILESDHFIIFIDFEYDLDWQFDDQLTNQIDKWPDDERKLFHIITSEIARIEGGSYDNLTKLEKINFKRQLGEALYCAIKKEFDTAKNLLHVAEEFANVRCEKNSKNLYRKYSIYALTIDMAALCIFILLKGPCSYNEVLWLLGIAGFAGGAGVWLSIALRIGNMQIDHRATKPMFRWEVAAKICAGVVSALFIGLCIKCNLIFGVFQGLDDMAYAMAIAGFISGFSERLTPSIINRFVDNEVENTETKTN